MATYSWSTLTDGQSIAFNPNADILNFDLGSLSAGNMNVSSPFGSVTITISGKAITLQTDIRTLTTGNVTFANGSQWFIGDNTTGTANDDGPNTLLGGSGADRFHGLGGNDLMVGNAGNDNFTIRPSSFGNDTVDGGTGADSFQYGMDVTTAATVNLANGTATNAGGNSTLISIEVVAGTSANDTFIGGDPDHARDSIGNTISERFRGRAGDDSMTGGAGADFFTTVEYDNASTTGRSVNLANGTGIDEFGDTDTLVNIDGVWGGAGNDTLLGGSLSRTGQGVFFESFRGNAGNDVINGNNSGTGGLDASTDRADYSNNTVNQAVNVNLGTGVALDGLGGTDTLIDIDQVQGGSGNDTLIGGLTNDQLDGGLGNDLLDGASGRDEARFSQSSAGVIINLSASSITINSVTVAAGTANDGMGGTDTLVRIEQGRGSDFADHMRGSDDVAIRESFIGEAGDDTIDGGAGIDFASYSNVALSHGPINALLDNGSGTVNDRTGGIDTLINVEGLAGTNSNDTLTGGAGDQWLRGRGGSDTLNGGVGSDWVTYSVDPSGVTINLASGTATDGFDGLGGVLNLGGTDTLISIENAEGSEYVDTITGSDAANELRGLDGNDTLNGGAGNDSLDGGVGTDRLVGNGGDDLYILTDADVVSESANAGTDTVQSSLSYTLAANVENLVLTGNATRGTGNTLGNDLTGNTRANTLSGGTGDDTLRGGTGIDTLQGGGDDDLYILTDADVVTESANAGTDTVQSSFSYTLGVNVENLVLTGNATRGTGNTQANEITGNTRANVLAGDAGNDTLRGGTGTDTLQGGGDDDLYIVTDADVVTESAGAGTDTVQSSFTYTLGANVENLLLTGNATRGTGNTQANALTGNTRANTLTGDAGNDTLNGGTGNDTLNGGAGNDRYILTDADVVTESANAGTDTVQSSVTYTLGANVENLVLTGNATRGTGNTQANALTGNTRGNTLTGGDGNDTLAGGLGNDTLAGGAGNDRFLFDTPLNGTSNVDSVSDFDPVTDALRLDDVVFTGLPLGTLTSSAFRSGTAAQDGDDRIIYNPGTGAVLFDSDGTGAAAAVRFATLSAGLAITNSDFIVV